MHKSNNGFQVEEPEAEVVDIARADTIHWIVSARAMCPYSESTKAHYLVHKGSPPRERENQLDSAEACR